MEEAEFKVRLARGDRRHAAGEEAGNGWAAPAYQGLAGDSRGLYRSWPRFAGPSFHREMGRAHIAGRHFRHRHNRFFFAGYPLLLL